MPENLTYGSTCQPTQDKGDSLIRDLELPLMKMTAVKNFTFLSLHALFICKFFYHTSSVLSLISYLFYT